MDNKTIKVLLQTYIEHLREKTEESKEINHHGKSITVEAAPTAKAAWNDKGEEGLQVRSVHENVQREALKEMYERYIHKRENKENFYKFFLGNPSS